jgi:hypothetical protein
MSWKMATALIDRPGQIPFKNTLPELAERLFIRRKMLVRNLSDRLPRECAAAEDAVQIALHFGSVF